MSERHCHVRNRVLALGAADLLFKASVVGNPIFFQIHSVCFCSFLTAQPESGKEFKNPDSNR